MRDFEMLLEFRYFKFLQFIDSDPRGKNTNIKKLTSVFNTNLNC